MSFDLKDVRKKDTNWTGQYRIEKLDEFYFGAKSIGATSSLVGRYAE